MYELYGVYESDDGLIRMDYITKCKTMIEARHYPLQPHHQYRRIKEVKIKKNKR